MRARGSVATGVVVLAYLGACATLAWATAGLLDLPGAAARFDVLVGLAACAGAGAVATWLAAVSALALAAETASAGSPLRRLARRVAPAAVRRLAALALGAGLAGSTVWTAGAAAAAPQASVSASAAPTAAAPTATAAPTAVAPGVPALDRPADDLAGWTPDRPAPPPRPRDGGSVRLVTTAPRAGTSVVEDVVVRRGDTLWDIAARHLGPGASAAEIAAEWPRWHAANQALVGPDPDLIRPGQRLSPPRP